MLGRQASNVEAGEDRYGFSSKGAMWRQDGASFARMWEEMGEATGTRWDYTGYTR